MWKKIIGISSIVVLLSLSMVGFASADSSQDRPSNLRANSTSEGISLTWNAPTQDSDEITGYNIQRKHTKRWETIKNQWSQETSYTDDNVYTGERKKYFYRVKAIRHSEVSGRSNVKSLRYQRPTISGTDILDLNSAIEARLDTRSEKDWYQVYLEKGKKYRFHAGGVDSGYGVRNPIITGLYDSDKNRVGSCRNYAYGGGQYSNDAVAKIRAPETGTYYIQVHSVGRYSGTYSITLEE